MGQLKSLERRLQKEETLPKRYQETIDTDVSAGCVRKNDQTELTETRNRLQWYFPHHPVINTHKPEKVRSVCKVVRCSPERLTSIWTRPAAESVRIFFCFREHQIALSADIEAMFLQVAVPNDESRCL